MIIEKRKMSNTNNIMVYIVRKEIQDDVIEKRIGTFAKPRDVSTIINHDADVYTEDGKLLLRFRKNVLHQKNINAFYDNMIRFAKQKTKTRGVASGSKTMNPGSNPAIMSNVFGYFDKWPIVQKHMFKTIGITPPSKVRICSFNFHNPREWEKAIPLIQEIDTMYSKMNPQEYKRQISMADQTGFRIAGTAFSTITTNVNLQTAYHRDKGDTKEGFGNLVVIEQGSKYTGGYTVFPQYGIGVDVRTGDYLAMDVHQIHGNTPIVSSDNDSIRLSIVCYLRKNIYEYSKGTDEKDVKKVYEIMKMAKDRYMKIKGGWPGAASPRRPSSDRT